MAGEADRQVRAQTRWEPHYRRGEWTIVNETGSALRASLAPADGEEFLTIDSLNEEYQLIGPGEGLPVKWSHRSSPNNYARVMVLWIEPDSSHRLTKTLTLRSSPPPVIYFG
ncbi:hypothetical protein ACAD34_03018 (plasmid) [Clavibacter nebraskensis]